MIRRAVEQRPDDGYIVDSLGWAYFRLGNYDEAVKNLERAVELKPDDPTINDHLGDAYWKTGRTLEAQFQWSHARDLKPEPEDLAKIKQKLATGLPEETSSAANAARRSPATAAERLPKPRLSTEARPTRRARRFGGGESADGDKLRRRWMSPWQARRTRPGQGQSHAGVLGRRSRRLSSARQPGGVRARRRPPDIRARASRLRSTCAARPRRRPAPLDDNLVLKAARALAAEIPGLKLGRFTLDKAPAGRGRPRRRIVRRRRRAAAPGPRQPPRARRSAAAQGGAPGRRRRAGLRRSAPAADARHRRECCRRRSRSRSLPRCWSIPASRCRPRTCLRMLGLKPGGARKRAGRARRAAARLRWLRCLSGRRAQRSGACRHRACSRRSRGCSLRCASEPGCDSRACRARARPASGCSPRRARPRPPPAGSRPRIRAGG